jgi:hypothetical protein
VSPSPLCSKQQCASFFREFGENPYRHQKLLVSNLGLIVFVKHLVKLVKLVRQIPQPSLREKKKKKLKGRDLTVFSIFAPYHNKSLQTFSLFS